MLGMLVPSFEFRMKLRDLNKDPRVPISRDVMSHFIGFEDNNYCLKQQAEANASLGKEFSNLRTVQSGADTNPVNNFVWLPYLPGFITYVPFDGKLPILTGKMSGCWLGLFMMDGQKFFYHIGTHDFDQALSERVKNCWKMAVSHKKILPYRAFKPDNYGERTIAMFGCISEKGTFYKIGCSLPRADPEEYKVENRSEIGDAPAAPMFH